MTTTAAPTIHRDPTGSRNHAPTGAPTPTGIAMTNDTTTTDTDAVTDDTTTTDTVADDATTTADAALADAFAVFHAPYAADPFHAPTADDIAALTTAYAAHPDGRRTAAVLRRAIADTVTAAGDDRRARGAASMAGTDAVDACVGTRSTAAVDAPPAIADVADARAIALADAVVTLANADGVALTVTDPTDDTATVPTLTGALAEAIAAVVNGWDADALTAIRDGGTSWPTSTTTAVTTGVTASPRTGSGGGPRAPRDLSAITGTTVAVVVPFDGDVHHATVTTTDGTVSGIVVTVTDADGEPTTVDVDGDAVGTFGSLSTWAGAVTGSNRNGWTTVRTAADHTVRMDRVCPRQP